MLVSLGPEANAECSLTWDFLSYFWVAAGCMDGPSAAQAITKMLATASSTATRCAMFAVTMVDDGVANSGSVIPV
jgi:hypothetical protein